MYKTYLAMGLLALTLVGAGCGMDDDDNVNANVNTNTTVNTNSSNANMNTNRNMNTNTNTNSVVDEDEDEDEDTNEAMNSNVNAEGLEEPVNKDVPSAVTITMEDMAFSVNRTVATGATITVVNNDTVPHTLTADDGSFDTGVIAAGDSATFTAPSTAGQYDYSCTLHPSMTGTLSVE